MDKCILNCTNKHYSRGLCIKHHREHKASGTLEDVALPRKNGNSVWHTLTEKDEESVTATCAVCGPNTPIEVRASKGSYVWRCSVKAKADRAEWTFAPENENRVYTSYYYGDGQVVKDRDRAIREKFQEEQEGRCAICGEKPEETLQLDHCHETGEFRGLLCRQHNLGLGYFGDNIELLKKAIEYLS